MDKSDLELLKIFNNRLRENKKIIFTNNPKTLMNIINKNINNNNITNKRYNKLAQINSSIYNYSIEKGKSVGIDNKSDILLSKGKYKIDYKLDLHGLRLEEAYNKIYKLFELSYINHYRCLLIITGKGLHSTGITIKESLINWFKQPFFSNKIIKYIDATKKDGGTGAVYVLLRKY